MPELRHSCRQPETPSGKDETRYFTDELPPSANSDAPVTKPAAGLARKAITEAISSGCAMRLTACSPAAHAFCSALPAISVSAPPESTALARMPCAA